MKVTPKATITPRTPTLALSRRGFLKRAGAVTLGASAGILACDGKTNTATSATVDITTDPAAADAAIDASDVLAETTTDLFETSSTDIAPEIGPDSVDAFEAEQQSGPAYALSQEIQSLGTAPTLPGRALTTVAFRSANQLISTSTSLGEVGDHHVFFSTRTADGISLDAKLPLPYALGAPVVNPLNPDQFATRFLEVDTNRWGWLILEANASAAQGWQISEYQAPQGWFGSAPAQQSATYANGMAFSSYGRLAVGFSNFIGGEYYMGTIGLLDTAPTPASTKYKYSFGTNLNGLQFVTLNEKRWLLAIDTGAITQDGISLSDGRLNFIPMEPGYATNSLVLPGGLNIGHNIAVTTTEQGTLAALPSATNDGKIYIVNLEAAANQPEQSAVIFDQELTLPNVVPSSMNLINALAFSPDGRYLFAPNQDTGRAYVYDFVEGGWVDEAGYQLDAQPNVEGEIGAPVWHNDGVYIVVGAEYLFIPHEAA